MRYLILIPLLCVGVAAFYVTVSLASADASPEHTVSAQTNTPDSDAVIAAERAERASHRAFYTAPPVIPHDLLPTSPGDCLTCHQEEREYFGKISTRTPHPHLSNCTQCHLSSKPVFIALKAAPVETTWKGLESPVEGTRAHVTAPPTMPHRKLLREDCQSCHSHQSPFTSMRGPHPQRMSCAQCHVPMGNNEFVLEKARVLPTH